MLLGSATFSPRPFDFGAALVQTSLIAARPAFELQFFNTQEAILDNLNKEIDAIQGTISTKGATALLKVQIAAHQEELDAITGFKTRTDKKAARVTTTLEYLGELITLADPATVAEFDAKLAATIDLMEKTKTPTYERFGVNDRLRKAKTDGLAQLNGLVHNNFATQQDIDDTVAILTAIQTDYLTSQSLVEGNAELAFGLQQNAQSTIQELSRQVTNIEAAALSAATGAVREKQKYYSQLLTSLSLAFEASQEFTTFIAKSVVLPKKTEPGSVVNLLT